MKIPDVPFQVTDWDCVPPVEHRGETGTSFWRTYEAAELRVRMVEYKAGFRSDHFCARGHVLLVQEGELHILLKDGQVHTLAPGMRFQAGDDEENPHLAYTDKGARVFIVD